MADTQKRCSRCDAAFTRDLVGGLCAACLLEEALPVVHGMAEPAVAPSLDSDLGVAQRFGPYELLEEIGRGGMGVVYRARQPALDRTVALKMLLAGEFADASTRQRLLREARIAARLSHPGIVTIHEVGEHQGRPYFAMEFVPGHNLAQLTQDGLLPVDTAVRYVERLARTVHYAHQHGVIHRDLKPANVLITPDDEPKLTDFGLTKSLVDPTRTLDSAGSPNYMAPEQADSSLGPTGVPTDVFGLGAILYQLLTGRPPAMGESLSETLRLVISCERVSPRELRPTLPRELETITLKCLERDPSRRFGSALEIAEELARWRNHEPIRTRPATPMERLVKWVRRRPMVAGLATALVVALTSGLIATLWQSRRAVLAADLARANEAEARGHAYAAEMTLADEAAAAQRWVEVESILNRTRPRNGQPDRRGWEWRYLWGLSQPDFAHRLGPVGSNRVVSMAELPDGRTWALGLREGGFSLWDVATRRRTYTHPIAINQVTVPDTMKGEWIATRLCSIPGTSWLAYTDCRSPTNAAVRLWDVPTRTEVRSLPLPWIPRHLAVSPDGRRLACSTMSADGRVYLFDVASGTLLRTLAGVARLGYSAGTDTLAFSPDGSLITLDDEPAHLRVVEVETGRDRFRLHQGENYLLSAAFSQDGRWLAVGSGFVTNRVRVWDLRTGELRAELPTSMPEPNMLQFDSGSRRLLAGPWIWSVPDFQVVRRLRGEGRWQRSARLARDDRTYLMEGHPGWVLVGDIESQPRPRGSMTIEGVANWNGHITTRGLAFISTNGMVCEARTPDYQPRALPELGTNGTSVCVWPEGGLMAVGREDGQVTFHHLDNLAPRGGFVVGDGPATALSFLPDHGKILVHDRREVLQVWTIDAPSMIWEAPTPRRGATAYLHEQTGTLYQVSPDGYLTVLDLVKKSVTDRPMNMGVLNHVAVSGDGRWIMVLPHEDDPRLLNSFSMREEAVLQLDRFVAHLGTFWPDGTRCALSGVGVRVVDMETRRPLLKLQADFGFGMTVAISPDGNAIFQWANLQPRLSVWQAPSWEEIRRAEGH